MRKNGLCGVLAAVALMAATDRAYAVVVVNCSVSGAGALQALFNTGGTADTTYQVTGPCTGQFNITQNNITIAGSPGPQTINGSIEIFIANRVTLENLTINGDNYGSGTVTIAGSPSVTIANSTIQNGPLDGIVVFGPARVNISNTTIQNNGGIGLHAQDGAIINTIADPITGNGGVGLLAERGSTVAFDTGSISQGSAPNAAAAVAQESSSVHLLSTTVTGPSNNHTVLVSHASSALIQGSTITADTPFIGNNQLAVIAAAHNASIELAGGNTITNSAGGAAVIVDAGSTLEENNGTSSGFSAAIDTITGIGRIHTQSVIELGALPGGGGVDWTGNIFLAQASSFRADGGNVTINGTLMLDQSANGYFNNFAGTSNSISLVQCNSTTDHVSNPTLVTPPITIGPKPGCALF